MARTERRGPRGQSPHHAARHQAKAAVPTLSAPQQAQVEDLVAGVPELAASLRDALADGRDAMRARLEAVRQAPEPVALAFAERLGELRGTQARDAADVAAALGELDARRQVARQARRAGLRLRSTGAASALRVPPVAVGYDARAMPSSDRLGGSAPRSSSEPLGGSTSPYASPGSTPPPARPQATPTPGTGAVLADAFVTRTREQGEVSLILGWQEGEDAAYVRPHVFQLDFWNEGAKDFALLEPMSRTRLQRELLDPLRSDTKAELVPITWGEARALVLEALNVNAWRGTQPGEDFRRHRALIDARLLKEPKSDAEREALARESERMEREGDRPYIAGGMEPDETLVNWIGAWSLGDFGLAYDLLAADHPLRRQQSRQEYIALRRQWGKEAQPSALRVTLVREQARRASALWVPGAAGAGGLGERKEMEAFWSLILHEAPEGGQLDELPLATLVSNETGRHWFWTGYTLSRDREHDLWLLSRSRDEGAASQALTVDELQQRLQEAHQAVESITSQPPPQPGSEESAEALRAITGALTAALHYGDALIVRLPLDEGLYRAAITDARTLANHERAAALFERMLGRFSDGVRLRFELGVEQYLVAEQYARQGMHDAEARWLERAVATMTAVVEAEPTAEHLQGLGDLLSRQGHFNQAEARLREAVRLDPQRALPYSDLADALMSRVSGADLDDPVPLSAEERQRIARDALDALREANRLDPGIHGIFTRMGAIYDLLGQPDDALIALQEAARRDPGDAEAHYALGTLYLSRQQPQDALGPLQTAAQLAPLMVPLRLSLAGAYAALSLGAEASRELDVVDQLQPGLPQVAELRAILARDRRPR
jgi:tetratricopeptide (TPR) repeat protein